MAAIGTPAAIRPIIGTSTVVLAGATGAGAGASAIPRDPSITDGLKPLFAGAPPGPAAASGSLMTSSARARCGRRRMKPRSSSAVMSRWMPDFDLRSSASFISSKDGGTPVSYRRSWISMSNSCCLRVSIGRNPFPFDRCSGQSAPESEQMRNLYACSFNVLQAETIGYFSRWHQIQKSSSKTSTRSPALARGA